MTSQGRIGAIASAKMARPEQTVREHIALIQRGRIDDATCDYAENAAVILPGQVVTGLDDIRIGLDGIGALLGDGVPE